MNVVVDNEFARIWSDDTSPIVFTLVRRIPDQQEQFEMLMSKQEDLIKEVKRKFSEVYAICDLSQCKAAPFELLFECCLGRLAQQFKAGVKFKAFVAPRNMLAQCSLDEMLKTTDETKVSSFKTFEESLNTINVLRLTAQQSKSPLTILKSLFFI
jgi:hypothetical protein